MPLRRSNTVPQSAAAASSEAPAAPLKDTSTAASAPPPPASATRTGSEEDAPTLGTRPADPAPGSNVPAVNAAGAMATAQPREDDGFGALDQKLGFGSFPIIKLDKNRFKKGDAAIGEVVYGVILGARPKWLYKEQGKQETEFLFYTYDKPGTLSHEVQAKLSEWEAAGIKWETKEYMECPFNHTDENGVSIGLALLNVPPASVNRLGGYRMECRNFRGAGMDAVLTKCMPGELVDVSKSISFYPWQFEFVRKL